MRLSKQMKKIMLLLSKTTPLTRDYIRLVLEEAETGDQKKAYSQSKRVSYNRSLKRLLTLDIIEPVFAEIEDVVEFKTESFKFYQLTKKGVKETQRIKAQLCKNIEYYQDLLSNVYINNPFLTR